MMLLNTYNEYYANLNNPRLPPPPSPMPVSNETVGYSEFMSCKRKKPKT